LWQGSTWAHSWVMASYDVQVHDRVGVMRSCRMYLQAASPSEAVMPARRAMPDPPGAELYTVYRHRRLGRRKLVGSFPATGGDDGLAGVREPRMPRPTPPSLRAEADPPAYRDS
jgi:hypothetical protein